MMKTTLLNLFFFLTTISLFSQTQIGGDINGTSQDDLFGCAVSISDDGNRVAIGVKGKNGNTGQVKVYQNTNGIWSQLGSDLNGIALGDQFGSSVSLSGSGNYLAIGAPFGGDSSGIFVDYGEVRIYSFSSSSNDWMQFGNEITGEYPEDYFGFSVSIANPGLLAIGTPSKQDLSLYRIGQVKTYVYQSSTISWIQIGSDLNGDDNGDEFGYSVSLSDNGLLLAVGAPGVFFNPTKPDAGIAKIYALDGSSNWNQIGNTIQGFNANQNCNTEGRGSRQRYGHSISISGTNSQPPYGGLRVAVGGPHNTSGSSSQNIAPGSVGVFYPKMNGTTGNYEWEIIQNSNTFLKPDCHTVRTPGIQPGFGSSVSLSKDGNILVVSDPKSNTQSGSSYNPNGRVYIFGYDSTSFSFPQFVQLGNDIEGDSLNDQFGASVSVSGDGNILAIGASENDFNAVNAGQVKVYNRVNLRTEEESLKLIIISPNPNSGLFSIQVDQKHIGSSYQILDNLGRLIDKGIIRDLSQDFDLSDKPKGVYRIQVSNEKGLKTLNVVIQ